MKKKWIIVITVVLLVVGIISISAHTYSSHNNDYINENYSHHYDHNDCLGNNHSHHHRHH